MWMENWMIVFCRFALENKKEFLFTMAYCEKKKKRNMYYNGLL